MSFNRLNPQTAHYGPGLAIASNGSLAKTPFFTPQAACEVISAQFVNGGRTSIASATAGGTSAVSVVLYKNASGTASRVATITNDGTAIGSATTAMTVTSTTSLKKLAAGDSLWIEVNQDTNSASALAVGWFVDVTYVYGYID